MTGLYAFNNCRGLLLVILFHLTRKLFWKPPIPREINVHLAHAIRSNFHTLISQSFRLAFSTSRTAAVLSARTHIFTQFWQLSSERHRDDREVSTHRCEIMPLALITRCQGTVAELKCNPDSAAGRDLRHTPTWRGRWASHGTPRSVKVDCAEDSHTFT